MKLFSFNAGYNNNKTPGRGEKGGREEGFWTEVMKSVRCSDFSSLGALFIEVYLRRSIVLSLIKVERSTTK